MCPHPIVSVIIPTYNRENLLPIAIDSVLSQSFKELELLIVDDRSTDNTEQLVDSYKSKDPRVRYLKNSKKRGPAGGRNMGIENAKGSYIAFLDSDDSWLPKKLEIQIHAMRKENAYFSATEFERENFREAREKIQSGNIFSKLLRINEIRTSSVVLHKDVIKKVGVFDESIFGTEDLDLLLRLAWHFDLLFIDTPLGVYVRHEQPIEALSGVDGLPDVDRHADRLKIYKKLQELLPLKVEHLQIMKEYQADYLFTAGYQLRTSSIKKSAEKYIESFYIMPKLKTALALMKLPFSRLKNIE